ncbi:MAG: hypothetical protein NT036_03820 [Candidatus Omnitrophica bacterium]|nr:hypothetical protein [Candidatus Omnitrophota bacterium]
MKTSLKYSILIVTFLCLFFLFAVPAHALEFSTKYSIITYSDPGEIDDFFLRLGGEHYDFRDNPQLAASLIDRLVDRIQSILGVIPRDLKFKIYLRRGTLQDGMKAYYDPKNRVIFISADYASQGVLAHEIGHAIVGKYFPTPLPSKLQEILMQYVDKYLWSDY